MSYVNVDFNFFYFYNNVSNVLWEHVYKFEINLMNINDPNAILKDWK